MEFLNAFFIMFAAGFVLAAAGLGLLKREQRRSLNLISLAARLAKYAAKKTGGPEAGYHPGSLSDPRD